jgi:YebC/PmpR family DNA-binding regulatory protein
MPKDNIQRAIKRGTGELDGGNLEDVLYEGYGPGGIAIMCEVLTDNRNRTAPEIRKVFEMSDGKLGGAGCVGWMFEKKGFFLVPQAKADEDRLMEICLDAGADDVRASGENFEILTPLESFQAVRQALADAGIEPDTAELSLMPKNTVDINDPDTARKVLKLMERLDDHDDVQNVSANFNIPDEIMAAASEA